jgi:hypothetical protein
MLHRSMLLFSAFVSFVLWSGSWAAGQAVEKTIQGTVSGVTLYRNQAMVTRTLNLDGVAGPLEVIVTNLPELIVADSLFAESNEGIEIRAVQYRTRAVGESPREEVRKLTDEIQLLADQLSLKQSQVALLGKQMEYLDKLEQFVAPAATAEMAHGILNAESLERLTTFAFGQREKILERQTTIGLELRELTDKKQLVEQKLGEITSTSSKMVREAVLYLNKTDALAHSLKLNYLVNGCGWSPSYTIRAESGKTDAQLEYNGLIYQQSGEDWSNVTLTLSTASPALSAFGPGIAPFRVTLASQEAQQSAANAPLTRGKAAEYADELFNKQQLAFQAQNNAVNFDQAVQSSWGVNDAANDFFCAILTGDSALISALESKMATMVDQPSLSYSLRQPVSLTSRNSQQMLRITQSSLPGEFYNVATPALTSYVYRQAEFTNNSSEDFLNGPVTVYLDGKFVGRGEIATVARGQTFVVGFGADPQLRTRRELAKKEEGVSGGNRELRFEYRLVVENFRDSAAPIRLLDRTPKSEGNADIRVTLHPTADPLSSDRLYERVERPEGILRWDIDVEAGSTGEKARIVEFSYTVAHDRSFTLTVPGDRMQQQQEFEQLEKARGNRK